MAMKVRYTVVDREVLSRGYYEGGILSGCLAFTSGFKQVFVPLSLAQNVNEIMEFYTMKHGEYIAPLPFVHRKAISWRACIYTVSLALFCFMLVGLASFWGSNQALLPPVLERKLTLSMSYEQTLSALSTTALQAPLKTNDPNGASYYCVVSDSGWGSLFVPQLQSVLLFDKNRTLTGGYAKIHYRLDEESIGLSLKR